jgi:hypothetical protein
MPSYANSIEACRKTGVDKAGRLASEYRKTYPNAQRTWIANGGAELPRILPDQFALRGR